MTDSVCYISGNVVYLTNIMHSTFKKGAFDFVSMSCYAIFYLESRPTFAIFTLHSGKQNHTLVVTVGLWSFQIKILSFNAFKFVRNRGSKQSFFLLLFLFEEGHNFQQQHNADKQNKNRDING